jgi:hypothetical protein
MNIGDKSVNGWAEWSKYVLKELERLNDVFLRLETKVDRMSKDMAELRVRSGFLSGIYGMVGGLIPIAVMIIMMMIKNGK